MAGSKMRQGRYFRAGESAGRRGGDPGTRGKDPGRYIWNGRALACARETEADGRGTNVLTSTGGEKENRCGNSATAGNIKAELPTIGKQLRYSVASPISHSRVTPRTRANIFNSKSATRRLPVSILLIAICPICNPLSCILIASSSCVMPALKRHCRIRSPDMLQLSPSRV